jgi:hypothetical protein
MPSFPYNLFLNAAFAVSIQRFVGEDGSCYYLAAIRIGSPKLHIGTFRVAVILSAAKQSSSHPRNQSPQPNAGSPSEGSHQHHGGA